jgi:hypothetical protein
LPYRIPVKKKHKVNRLFQNLGDRINLALQVSAPWLHFTLLEERDGAQFSFKAQ